MSETQSTILNPGRDQVKNLVGQALEDAEEPAQCFADILMAMCQIGHMADVDMNNLDDMIKKAMPGAIVAGNHVMEILEKTHE